MSAPDTRVARASFRRPRGVLAALSAVIALGSVAAVPARAATSVDRVLFVGTDAPRVVTGGDLTTVAAPPSTPGVDLLALRMERDGDGYLARLTFASPFHQLTSIGGVPA